ncbi:MAG: hypothetical protein CMH54_13700 [Myxococcales bacterium]|nr:hypothetical protein [Myxococcales bacterium]
MKWVGTTLVWATVGLCALACGDNRKSQNCVPGQSIACTCPGGDNGGQVCNADGSGYEACQCGTGEDALTGSDSGAADSTGTDIQPPSDAAPPKDTDPGLPPCGTDSDCPADLPQCTPQGSCVFCYPGTKICEGDQLMICEPFGKYYELLEDCGVSQGICYPDIGVCISPCDGFGKLTHTNAGCDFFAVDLRNVNGGEGNIGGEANAQDAPFAVVVSNVSESLVANVTITLPDGQAWAATVNPLDLGYFLLPPTYGIPGPGGFNSAYRIESSSPIVAYQFNPLDNASALSNDASVLLPVSELGTEYYAMTVEHFSAHAANPIAQWPGYITLVGVQPEGTQVTVTPTALTAAGDNLPAMNPGQATTVTVGLNEVIQIETEALDGTGFGGDLTGTHIQSNKPVLVFSGHVAGRLGTECCGDHLEQQLPPVSSWGKEFVLGRSMERGEEKDYVRVLAAQNGTQVQINGSATPGGFSLNKGGFQEVMVDGHIQITADKPILVAQFLAPVGDVTTLPAIGGSSAVPCDTDADCGQAYVCKTNPWSPNQEPVCQTKDCSSDAECGGFPYGCLLQPWWNPGKCGVVGDPSMILAVPVEQWQSKFVFLTPDSYMHDYINLVIPQGTVATLDGVAIPADQLETIPGTTHRVYRAEVTDGVHIIESEAPAALTVYGYDTAVSYGYPGAMGLKNLVAP